MIYTNSECFCCSFDNLEEVIDLNDQPLANNFHDNTKNIETYPLILNLCPRCYHLQLSHTVDPKILFKHYLYVSGTTNTLREYFEWFFNFVVEYTSIRGGKVLDIACNDGTQLNFFKNNNWKTYGIDPAVNLKKLNSSHKTVCDFFKKGLFNEKFDIIIAQNVFAHNNNPYQFLLDCKTYMNESSYMFVQTSQSDMISNGEFDTIYHEHLSFFNINSFNTVCERAGISLIDVIKTPIHGTSYIFVLKLNCNKKYHIKNLIDNEKGKGLLLKDTYFEYKNNILLLKQVLTKKINELKNDGYKIVGYGAAAKGMTLLNFCNISLDIVIDDNPIKHNLYTPGTNIRISSIDYLDTVKDNTKIAFVPLAWNFYDEIKKRITKKRKSKSDVFIKYFPNVYIDN